MTPTFKLVLGFTLILLVIFVGIIVFVMQYSRRAIEHRDMLKVKEREKQVELLNATIEAQEGERARIGSDIHDDIGPLLSTLKLYTNRIKYLDDQEERNAYIDSLGKEMDDVIVEIRRVAKDLVPMVLMEFGLAAALENLCERINETKQVVAYLQIRAPIDALNKSEELALYRIVQEFCNNSIKYASATQIDISFSSPPLTLHLGDNGVGFEQELVDKREFQGLGLKNMNARAQAIEAEFELTSKPDHGTRAVIILNKGAHVQ